MSLASSTASSSLPTRNTIATGPKNSSRAISFDGSMSVRTVGSKKLPSRPPPTATFAPLSTARASCSESRSAAFLEDSGPIAESSEVGSPGLTSPILAVSFSRKGS